MDLYLPCEKFLFMRRTFFIIFPFKIPANQENFPIFQELLFLPLLSLNQISTKALVIGSKSKKTRLGSSIWHLAYVLENDFGFNPKGEYCVSCMVVIHNLSMIGGDNFQLQEFYFTQLFP